MCKSLVTHGHVKIWLQRFHASVKWCKNKYVAHGLANNNNIIINKNNKLTCTYCRLVWMYNPRGGIQLVNDRQEWR